MGRYVWRDLGARPALFPAASLALGAWFGEKTGCDPGIFLATALALGLISLAFSRRTGAHLALLAACFAGGAGLAGRAALAVVPPLERSVRLEGVVEDVGRGPDQGGRLVVEVARVFAAQPEGARFRTLLYSTTGAAPPGLLPGQRVLLQARLRPEEPAANWGQADRTGLHRRRALLFTGHYDPERLVVLSPPSPIRTWLADVHGRLAAEVVRRAPSPEAAQLYLTLAAGLRAELGDATEEEFSRSGLVHVLSVSGLHVAALALFALRLLRFATVRLWPGARRIEARRVAAPLSIPLIWAYVAFTGGQPPAVRSAVMASVFLLGLGLWRPSDALNSLALAAIAVIAVDPSCVADLSMQLSFSAVAALILLAPALREALPLAPPTNEGSRVQRALRRAREGALQTLCASAAVTLAGLPLVASTFHRVSFAGLLSNVICLPLCAVLTGLAAAGAAVFVAAPPLAGPILWCGGWAAELLVWAARLFSRAPLAAVDVPSIGPLLGVGFGVGLAVFALASGRWRLGGLLAPAAVAAAFLPGLGRFRPPLEVTFLSVGHGDAIVISSGGAHALVDGGGVPGGADTGRKYVLPYLRERWIDRLELAVLSHPHPDHALGLASVLAQVPTRRLWLAAGTGGGDLSTLVAAAAEGAAIEEVHAGRPTLRLGEVEIEVLGPPSDSVLLEGVNDRSVVLLLRHREVTFLLTGDLEEAGEQALRLSPVTVVKAPHHGSRTSSTAPFVEATRPRHVVFCVGRGNRFGFPHPEVVERYVAEGARCHRTDVDGAIRFFSDGRDVRVETFRRPTTPEAPAPVAASGSDDQGG